MDEGFAPDNNKISTSAGGCWNDAEEEEAEAEEVLLLSMVIVTVVVDATLWRAADFLTGTTPFWESWMAMRN